VAIRFQKHVNKCLHTILYTHANIEHLLRTEAANKIKHTCRPMQYCKNTKNYTIYEMRADYIRIGLILF